MGNLMMKTMTQYQNRYEWLYGTMVPPEALTLAHSNKTQAWAMVASYLQSGNA